MHYTWGVHFQKLAEKQNRKCLCARTCVCERETDRQTDMYVKELAYVIVEADRSKICWVGWQVDIQIRVDVAV